MRSEFSEQQRRAIGEMVGLPSRLHRGAVSGMRAVPTAEIRRLAGLAPPRFGELLAPDCWLVGGSVMRWLCRNLGRDAADPGDYDFFVPSIDAFNTIAHSLLSNGFTFRCFRARRWLCMLCGRPGEPVAEGTLKDRGTMLARIRCEVCGEFGGVDAASLTPDRLLRLTPELIEQRGIFALELASATGDLVHLSAYAFRPTAGEAIAGADFSTIQFALDDQFLYFGPHAWTDLLTSRIRLLKTAMPYCSFQRLQKFAGLGFRPYLETSVRLRYLALCGFDWRLWRAHRRNVRRNARREARLAEEKGGYSDI